VKLADLSLIEACVTIVSGDQSGSGYFIGPDLIATSAHVVGNTKRPILGSGHQVVEVIHPEPGSDLLLLRIDGAVDEWMAIDTARSSDVGAEFLIPSFRAGQFETTTVFIEGVRGTEIKLTGGQVRPSFSGSPLLSLASGGVIGQIRATRDVSFDLGGYAVALTRNLSNFLGANAERIQAQAKSRWAGLLSADEIEWLSQPPYKGVQLRGRAAELAELRAGMTPNTIGFLSGRSGAGTSHLAATWLETDSPTTSVSSRGYVDLRGFTEGENPALRAILRQLEITIPVDALGEDTRATRVAMARVEIRNRLMDGYLVIDHFQELIGPSLASDLEEAIYSGAFASSRLLLVGTTIPQVAPAAMRRGPQVELGALSTPDARDFLLGTGMVDIEFAMQAIAFCDPAWLIPIVLIRAVESPDAFNDAVDFGIATEAAFRAITSTPPAEFATGLLETTLASLMAGIDDVGSDGASARTSILRLIARPEYRVRVVSVLDQLRPDELSDRALEIIVGTVRLAGIQSEVANALAEELLLRTASDPLGAIAVGGDGITGITRTMLTASSAWGLYQEVKDIDWSRIVVSPRVVDLLWSTLKELEGRFDHSRWVQLLREAVIESIIQNELSTAASFVRIVVDAAMSAAKRGQANAVATFLDMAREHLHTSSDESIVHRIRLAAAARLVGIELDFEVDLQDATDRIGLGNELFMASIGARVDLFRASVGHADASKLAKELKAHLVSGGLALRSTNMASRVAVSLVRYAFNDLPPDDAVTEILEMVQLLRDMEPMAKSLARAGDNRSILALARSLRRLGTLQLSQGSKDSNKTFEESRQVLTWVIEDAPSAAAWLTYFRSAVVHASWEGSSSLDEMVGRSSLERVIKMISRYRKWRSTRSGGNHRDLQVEYLCMELLWREQGSLVRMAIDNDDRWMRRSVLTKKESLRLLFEQRLADLDRLRNLLGPSVEDAIVRAQLITQYETSIAVATRSAVNTVDIDREFEEALQLYPHNARLLLEWGKNFRQRRKFQDASEKFVQAILVGASDPYLLQESRVAESMNLLERARTSDTTRRHAGAQRALELVLDIADRDEVAAFAVAFAELELSDGEMPDAFVLVEGLMSERRFEAVASQDQSDFEQLKLLDDAQPSAQAVRFLGDHFTEPLALARLARYFLRSFELAPARLATTFAALNALRGTRQMSDTSGPFARRGVTPTLRFLEARALVLAMSSTGTPNPIGWATISEETQSDDYSLALSKLRVAQSMSTGSFHAIVNLEIKRLRSDQFRENIGLKYD
jgi:tetratricopeptide (TPR) repeat protein